MKAREMINLAYNNRKAPSVPNIVERKLATSNVAYEIAWGFCLWPELGRYKVSVFFASHSKPLLQYLKSWNDDDLYATIANARAYIDSLRDELEGIE